ncbi:MAG: Ku protein, partial [Burkholderiaceae bacterium]
MSELDIERTPIAKPELQLALQLIDQISAESYDPASFEDEEKKRILAAIDDKIAGKQVIVNEGEGEPVGGQVIDLMEALRASLSSRKPAARSEPVVDNDTGTKVRKAAKRATPTPAPAAEPAPAVANARGRARK